MRRSISSSAAPHAKSVLVYGHANGETVDAAVEAAAGYVSRGYKAVRAQCGVPGMQNVYGVASGVMPTSRRSGDRFSETVWSSERYLSCVAPLFERLRRELGYDVHLLHDVHHRLRADRSRPARQRPRAVPAVLDGRSDTCGESRELPSDPPAHDDAAGGRGGVQHHPRLPAADSGATDRLHPRHGRARRRASVICGRSRAWRSCIRFEPDRTAQRI